MYTTYIDYMRVDNKYYIILCIFNKIPGYMLLIVFACYQLYYLCVCIMMLVLELWYVYQAIIYPSQSLPFAAFLQDYFFFMSVILVDYSHRVVQNY